MTEAGKAVIDQQEGTEGGASGDGLGAPFSLPALSKSTLTHRRPKPTVILPDGSRVPSGGGFAGVSSPAGIYQQTPTAACASDAAAPITGGLGVFSRQQAAQGIYLCIAFHYHC